MAAALWEKKTELADHSTIYKEFEDDFIYRIRSEIISVDVFRASFKYEPFYFFIPLPSIIENDLLEKEKAMKDREDVGKEREKIWIEVDTHRRIMDEIAKQKSEQVEGFLSSTVGEIRKMIMNVIQEVRRGMALNEESILSDGTKKRLMSMIDKVRTLNFYDDEEMSRAMDQLQVDLDKDREYRSQNEILKSIEDLEKIAEYSINNIIGGRISLLEF